MPRRKRTPEEIARKERTKALMKELNIKDMDDIQDLFKSFVAAALEGGLEAELDEELGYSSTIIATKKPITVAMVTVKRP